MITYGRTQCLSLGKRTDATRAKGAGPAGPDEDIIIAEIRRSLADATSAFDRGDVKSILRAYATVEFAVD